MNEQCAFRTDGIGASSAAEWRCPQSATRRYRAFGEPVAVCDEHQELFLFSYGEDNCDLEWSAGQGSDIRSHVHNHTHWHGDGEAHNHPHDPNGHHDLSEHGLTGSRP